MAPAEPPDNVRLRAAQQPPSHRPTDRRVAHGARPRAAPVPRLRAGARGRRLTPPSGRAVTIPILSLRSEIRALPRSAWILYAETLVNRLGTFVLVFLVLWLTRIGWSPGMAGLAVSVYGFGGLFASLIGG